MRSEEEIKSMAEKLLEIADDSTVNYYAGVREKCGYCAGYLSWALGEIDIDRVVKMLLIEKPPEE